MSDGELSELSQADLDFFYLLSHQNKWNFYITVQELYQCESEMI